MGNIRTFSIELTDRASGARLTLAGGREFAPACFFLDFGDITLRLHPDQADRFAWAIKRLSWRRRDKAAGREPKAGPVWTRQLGDGAGLNIAVQFGTADEGLFSVQVGSTKVVCDEAQSDVFTAVLSNFADDIYAIGQQAAHRRSRRKQI
jgi:hypothetical protein